MTDDITAISLRGVRELIEDKSMGESVLDAVDGLLGLVIVLSPVVIGPAALPLLVETWGGLADLFVSADGQPIAGRRDRFGAVTSTAARIMLAGQPADPVTNTARRSRSS